MRKLVYLLAVTLLLGTLEAARACEDRFLSYEQLLADASSVFVGHIVHTEVAGIVRESDHVSPVVEGTFRVVGVLKGEPPADGKVRAYAEMHCNVRLLAGQEYAIFLYGDNFIRGHQWGTTPLRHAEKVDAKRLLEHLHEQEKEAKALMLEELRSQQKLLIEGKVDDCYTLSDEQAFAESTTVFWGHLTRTEEVEVVRTGNAPPPLVLEATFQVLDVLKGQAPSEAKARRVAASKACMPFLRDVDLVPGNDFLVFLDHDNVIRHGTWSPSFLGAPYAGRYREKLRGLSGKAQ